jgi:hypothetical protein
VELTRDPAPPGTDADASADEAGGAYADFLSEMEALGLLSDLEEELPPDFSAVFEIGRILAAPGSRTGAALATALELRPADTPEQEPPPEDEENSRIEVPAAEEYEAEFIRTWRDVQYVYSWQWLLPDEVFLRRLAQRTLWFPMAKTPKIRRIEGNEGDFLPTPAKQKAYVLFDTSASMALHHRFAFAKAIVLRFLRENRREMGEVSLRTFDVDVGPLETANDTASYDALIRSVARRRTLGNGTCLERALLQSCRDIRERKGLAGAEILVVTDGAAHLDAWEVREALGRDVELHCVKIGTVQVAASDRYVADQLEYSQHARTRREQRILQVRERRLRLEESLRYAHDETTRRSIVEGLAGCDAERREIAQELKEEFGHEIESLAHVFVQVPDIDPSVLSLTPEQLASLDRLVRELLARLRESPASPELMKQAALLLSHVALLASEQMDGAVRERLEALRRELEGRLTEAIHHHEDRVLEAGLLSPGDQRDLRILLRRGVTRHSSLWLALLRYFYSWVSRASARR